MSGFIDIHLNIDIKNKGYSLQRLIFWDGGSMTFILNHFRSTKTELIQWKRVHTADLNYTYSYTY